MGWKPTPEQMEIMKEDEYLVDSGILDRAIQDAKQVWYGIVRWHPDDIIEAAKNNGVEMTFEQAIEWWEKNEESFKARMTEMGNEVLAYMDY